MQIRRILTLTTLAVLFTTGLTTAETKTFTCKGTVLDTENNPIDGAEVINYEIGMDLETRALTTYGKTSGNTGPDGAFEFTNNTEDEKGNSVSVANIIVARKEGYSLGWLQWQGPKDKNENIILKAPKNLVGRIVDENGKPIENADISVIILGPPSDPSMFLINPQAMPFLQDKTDSQGNFNITGLPSECAADFNISKEGYASISTFTVNSGQPPRPTYDAGTEEIELTLPPESIIKGKVISSADGSPVPNVKVAAVEPGYNITKPNNFATTNADGSFTIKALAPNDYELMLATDEEAGYIADKTKLSVVKAQTLKDIEIQASQGGLLEVKVTDSQTNEPMPQVSVNLAPQSGGSMVPLRTNADGVATRRLAPGEYKINNLYMSGMGSKSPGETITIKEGETTNWQYEFEGPPTVTGTITDPSGEPVSGATVFIRPGGSDMDTTDEQGKYSTRFSSHTYNNTPNFLIAALPEKNLAAITQVMRESQTQDLQLTEGITAKCRVIDAEGKLLQNATVRPWIEYERGASSMSESVIEKDGDTYVWKAIPADGDFRFDIYADGYGSIDADIDPEKAVDFVVDLGDMTLPLADKIVSGVVLDADREPVGGARVRLSGDNQPSSSRVETGKDGKFEFKACDGPLRLYAYTNIDSRHHWGDINLKQPTEDVEVFISPNGARGVHFARKKAEDISNKPLGDLAAFGIDAQPAGKTLVCFFDMMQRPSRHLAKQLAAKADNLKQQGVNLVFVQSSKIDSQRLTDWLESQKIGTPAGMIKSDNPDDTLKQWGVENLPWLILTDTDKNVTAQGFRLTKLDEKLE
ncbi:putative lipoprotein, rSAM/lipoprotein system [Anaerohalosphaera lusitana]|uniref:Putative lipoprotein, rSAM/lipoprotein system n=1 Tax=Anaerohalosphaera lusitana TaxID=1936003 RepID=A0A1U9NKE0_9BACT|nr:carboxypeptidase-like regulatory domain-containing protein [Anaerohalosphaera lusitana]AQT68204.1 putative lipoprotein, rSAM/lipoprotein system [Anaerohalosphaera lusitana]